MKRELTLSIARANLLGALMIIPTLLLGLLYLFIWASNSEATSITFSPSKLLLFLVIAFLGIILHELIHGLTWAWLGRQPFGVIKFGFKSLTPYAHCTVPLPARAYRWGTLMPGLLLGILPYLLSLLLGSFPLMLLALFFTLGAGGDALILWLLHGVAADQLVADHPTAVGCYLIDKADAQIPSTHPGS